MEETVHKRRVRYKGRYPRKYSEKYKELDPEKYAETVKHVIEKGSTPAGMHIPIMVEEILAFFDLKPGMKGFDATLGYGGHSLHMLKKLDHQGMLYASDVDPIEIVRTRERIAKQGFSDQDFSARLMNFSQINELVQETGPFNFILADLGVSSMQIDNPDRGFTYKAEGPLDLRMDPTTGISAAELLQQLSEAELEMILIRNSDEPFAKDIAKTIFKYLRRGQAITTTGKLYSLIADVFDKKKLSREEKTELVKKSAARTFQALRIEINHEFEVLSDFLNKLPESLADGGKVAILTFHSGEDRLVKQAFKEFARQGIFSAVSDGVIRPSAEECIRNSRAHSVKMRWAIK